MKFHEQGMYATQYNDLLVTSMFDCTCIIDSIVQNVSLKCFLAIVNKN